MVELSIKVERNEKLQSESVDAGISRSLPQIADIVQTSARSKHRYKSHTGNLLRSTKTRTTKDRVQAYIDDSKAKYGKYIHDGHGKWAPDRFIDASIEDNLQQIDNIVLSNIDNELIKDK